MSLPLVVRAEAEQDLREGRDWYDGQRTGLGIEFLECVAESLDRVRDMPELYAKTYKQVRRCPVRRFSYVIYYRIRSDHIEVLGVVHASRRSRVWRSRA